MNDRSTLIILALISLTSWVIAYLLPQFPWSIVVALSPLFAIYQLHKERQWPFVRYGIWIVVTLVLVHGLLSSLVQPWAPLPMAINFGILLSFAFFAYWLTDKYAQNRLGLVTVILYYAGLEYLALLFIPESAYMLLGSSLADFPAIQRWNGGTGLGGVSIWILAANIATYHILFRDRAIFQSIYRWRSMLIGLILLSVPAFISVWFYSDAMPVDPAEINSRFSDIWASTDFASAGEIAGRTCAWISVFIVLYGLVKRKIEP